VGLYGAGRCAKHLAPKRNDDDGIKTIEDTGGMVDEKKVDTITKQKPHMDNIISKLNAMKTLKRRKIVFDG
jgi:hypothetical protein